MKKLCIFVLTVMLCLSFSHQYNAKTKEQLVFIGDSRFVMMQNATKSRKGIYIAKRSMGYEWFASQEENFRKYDSKSTTYVIGFGVNDVYHVDEYITYVSNLDLKGKVYFCQVNPVDEEKEKEYGYTVSNDEINEFNKTLAQNAVEYKVLKTNKYLKKRGYTTVDGLHYDSKTYRILYNYIRRHV